MPITFRFRLPHAPLLLLPMALWMSALAGTVRAEDWPRWGGPRGNETWRGPKLREQWPTEGLKRLWQRPLGGGYGGVAAVGDRVLVMDRQTEPTERERLLCCDAATGREQWLYETPVEYGKLDYGNGPRAMPVIDGNRVYVLGALGHFACLELETGKLLWKYELRDSHGARIPTWGLAASPLILGQLVIVHPGGTPNACWVAFDKQTGKEVWRSGDDPAGYAIPVLVEAPSGPLLIGWSPTHIVGMLPRDG
ncbi:MAG: PQQ-binding-like beta-propeller repeat protein, partial [Planctomycetaceae bacterium]